MDEIESISTFPPLSVIAMTVCGLAIASALVRPSVRLQYSLGQMAFLLTLSRLPNLGEMAGLAKLCSGFSLLVVCLAALSKQGPYRPLSSWVLAYPVLAAFSVLPVSGALDWQLAMAIRMQWLLMTIAAVLVCRCLVDTSSANDCLRGLATGLGAGACVSFTSLVLDPSNSFYGGLGRFTPYGCNPNQFAIVYAITCVLGLYLFCVSERLFGRFVWGMLVLVGSVGVLMCVSRMAMGVMALAGLPSVLLLAKRPILAALLIGLVAFAGFRLVSSEGEFDLTHIENAHGASRWDWTSDVLEEISQRPLFGLLFAEHSRANEEGLNAHNAYIEMAYLCGVTHAIPNALSVLLSIACAAHCLWSGSQRFKPLLLKVLACLLFASIINGLVNNIIYYPTYTWAFLHVLLSVLFISEALQDQGMQRRQSSFSRTPAPSIGRHQAC